MRYVLDANSHIILLESAQQEQQPQPLLSKQLGKDKHECII